MEANNSDHPQPDLPGPEAPTRLPVIRSALGGILMGLANLVPGVSGGTMIVVMGLYDEFISSIADVTRLRFSKRNLAFLGIVGGGAVVAIAALAETLSRAVTLHPGAMYSLFIGMTLGGAPLLIRMLGRRSGRTVGGILLGLAIMVVVGLTREEAPNKEGVREAVARGEFVIEPAYARDVSAGALGVSAMVLPGISGAYMLLILGRYEAILAAVSLTTEYALSLGREGDPQVFLRIMLPTAIGAVLSIVFLSNLLKWLLYRHRDATLGLLLGILLGSVVGIWPFDAASQAADYGLGVVLAGSGFAATFLLSKISA